MTSLSETLFPKKTPGVQPKSLDMDTLRRSPALQALETRPQAPREYPWQNKANRKLPRVVSVTCTITASEFTRLAEEAAGFGVSLSELGRERVMAPVPLEQWGQAAAQALESREDELEQLRLERNAQRRAKYSLKAILESDTIEQDKVEKLQAQAQGRPKRERRVAQLQIRLTAYETVTLRWTAFCLKMTQSSFIRKMVLGYLPGGEDDQTIPWESTTDTRNTRTGMLQAVIEVANAGRIPASTSLFYCKSCAQVLSPSEKH